MTSGSLTKTQQLTGAVTKIEALCNTLTALGQDHNPDEKNDIEEWFDLSGLKDLVARMRDKVNDTWDGVSVAKKKKLQDETKKKL